MIDPIITTLSSGGMIAVAAYLIYYITKENRRLFDKLIKVIENNNSVITELKIVINEMRHEILSKLELIDRKINGHR